MTEIEQKALAQAVAAAGRRMQDYAIMAEENVLRQSIEAHARAIERHEAFRQEVSDAVEKLLANKDATSRYIMAGATLGRFIIAKPDPLVEVMNEWWDADGYANIDTFRTALAKHGFKLERIEHE